MNSYPQKPVVPRPKTVSQGGTNVNRLLGIFLLLVCAVGFSVAAKASNWTANNSGKDVAIVSESCQPPNGYVDPGETNQLSFVVHNTSGSDQSNVKVSILQQGNVWVLSGQQSIGTVVKDATFTVTFTIRAVGSCGDVLTPTLQVTSGSDADHPSINETISYVPLQLGATVKTSYINANATTITINDYVASDALLGRATPYPSGVTVANVPKADSGETVDNVAVTLNGFTHQWTPQVRVMLLAPNGKSVILMANAGGATDFSAAVNNINLTFDDVNGSTVIPTGAGAPSIASGTYKVSNFAGATALPDAGTATDTALGAFNGIADPNGTWKLYVQDSVSGFTGFISGGWTLNLRTTKIVCCAKGQTFPFVNTPADATVPEDLNGFAGNKNVHIADFIVFDLDDADSSKLTVAATSSDQSKVTDANLVVGNQGSSGTARTLTVNQLVTHASGSATITIFVTDQQGHTSSTHFQLNITPINYAPTITPPLGQKLTPGTPTGPLAFTVGDVETIPDNLVITATSGPDKQTIVPDQNIVLGGSGANRTINVIPFSSTTSGSASISIIVRDQGFAGLPPALSTNSFTVNFGATPGFPTITPMDGQTFSVKQDSSVTIPFQVRSGTSASPDSLVVTATADFQQLVPSNALVLGGSGINRTLTITPAFVAGGGVTTIHMTVSNGSSTDSTSFTLNVNPVNRVPSISTVGTQSVNENSTSGDIVFSVGDVETGASDLTITVTSSDTSLVPNLINPADLTVLGGIKVTANGATRTLNIHPVPNKFGTATITVTVSDRGSPDANANAPQGFDASKAAATSFLLIVNAVNQQPTIAAVGNDSGSLVPFVGTNIPAISFPKDSGTTVDPKAQRTIVLSGISPGPSNEAIQTVSLSASSSKPDVVSIVKIDPASVTGLNQNSTMTIQLGTHKFTNPGDPVIISLTMIDNGGVDLGGNNTTVKQFYINVLPVNNAPTLSFPTVPPAPPGQTPVLLVAKGLSFTVPISLSDIETPNNLINMSATITSDPQVVFPPGSVLFDLPRTVMTFLPSKIPTILPYLVSVTVSATDLGGSNLGVTDPQPPITTIQTFNILIEDIQAPTLSVSSSDIGIDQNSVASALLTVGDNHPVSNLTLSGTSDNPSMLPAGSILFGPLSNPTGLSSTAQIAIVPAQNFYGTANVTISAKDDEGLTTTTPIKLTVRHVNQIPTIALKGAITPVPAPGGTNTPATIAINQGSSSSDPNSGSKLLEFDVTDAFNETPAVNLVITPASGNTNIIPNSAISIGLLSTNTPNVAHRTVTVTPPPNQATSLPILITLTVTDDSGLSSSATFNVVINQVNQPPAIDQHADITVLENAVEQTVTLTGVTAGNDIGQSVISMTASAADIGSNPAVDTLLTITQQPTLPDSSNKSTLKFLPIPFKYGTSVVSVVVGDNGGTSNNGKNSTTMKFNVIITAQLQNPTFSWDRSTSTKSLTTSTPFQTPLAPTQFFVTDPANGPDTLQVTATSSNTNVVSNDPQHILLGGTSGNRSISVVPNTGGYGNTTITITVKNLQGGFDTGTLNLTVGSGNAPTISITPNSESIHVNQFTDLIQLFVNDAQTPADQLKIGYQDTGLVTSDNPTLVPASPSNIQFGGVGANRSMIILPRQDQAGVANIQVGVKDSDGNTTFANFKLTVLGAPPTISSPTPSSVTVSPNTQSSAVTVTVGSASTFPGFLTVTGKSSDQAIVADQNIFALGNADTRSVTVLAGAKGGTATITLTVADQSGQTAKTTFTVTVVDSNTPPTITSIPAQSTPVNTPTGLINFIVGDKETAASSLAVAATSANATLVPNDASHISILASAGNPGSRSLILTPAANQTGNSVITVTVTDGGLKTTSTTFTLTVSKTSVPNDFNGDGSQDIIFQDAGGFLAAWFMSGDDVGSTSYLTPNNVGDKGWTVVGTGDFNGDGKPDLLYQHTDGSLAVWYMNGVTMTSSAFLNPANSGTGWKAVAVGDFNKDGKPDILFQAADSSLAIWYMDGINVTSVVPLKPGSSGAGWRAFGTGDLNGDGNLDILFQNTDGSLAVWYMIGGNNVLLSAALKPATTGDKNWVAVGTIDLNGDGKADILFQNSATGDIAIWYMNGPNLLLGKLLTPSNAGGTWKVVAP